MTTLEINDPIIKKILAKYGENKIFEYIKTFQESKDDLDTKIKKLKIINKKRGEKLGDALTFLGKDLDKNIDYKELRNEYLTKKYKIGA